MMDTKTRADEEAAMAHIGVSNCRKRSLEPSTRRFLAQRRGLSTAWLLLFGPVFLVLLALVVEIGNIYVAQAQLENAMEAAALAAVKEWGGTAPNANWTETSRQVGAAYGNANEVAGKPLGDLAAIGLNYQLGGTSNNNVSSSGDLVFGSVSFAEPFIFKSNVEPECTFQQSFGNASVRWIVTTGGCASGTWGCANAFQIEWFQAPANQLNGWYIKRVTIRTQATPGIHLGEFDFHPDAPLPTSEDYTNASTREGWGPFYNAGASVGITTPPTFFQGVDGNLPISVGQSTVLTLEFADNDFTQKNKVVFGVDTDNIGKNTTSNIDTKDLGSEFKAAGSAFVVEFLLTNGTDQATVSIPASDTRVTVDDGEEAAGILIVGNIVSRPVEINIPGTGNFAVRAQKTITIPSLTGGVLGINSTFSVYAQATAMWRCDVNDVSLIRPDSFQ
jgi:Flp pilus assembly protein TadG